VDENDEMDAHMDEHGRSESQSRDVNVHVHVDYVE